MGKKVAKKKGKNKKKGGAAKAAPAPVPLRSAFEDVDGEPARLLAKRSTDHVDLELRLLVNWPYANIRKQTRAGLSLAGVARLIEERHGRVLGLKLYRDPPNAANEITDFSRTLGEAGVRGGARDKPVREVLYYDFRPADHGPLLLREPELLGL